MELDFRSFQINIVSILNPKGLKIRTVGPDAKKQVYHQLNEIKFCMSHYNHNSMPDAKFESGSCQFQQFPSRGKFLDVSMKKRAAATPLIDQFR